MTKEKQGVGVVMLTPNFYPYIGGAEKQALELSKRLLARGVRVSVLTRCAPGLSRDDAVEGIPVRRAFTFGSGFLNAAVFMVSSFLYLILRRSEYDVIHVHLAGSPAISACLAGSLLGRKVVVKVGGGRGIGEIAMSRKTWSGRMKLALFRIFRPQFVSVTEDLKEEMSEVGLSEGTYVIPNGVDVNRYQPRGASERRSLRKDFGWPEGLCFLYVGRLAVEKRLDMFLRAFAEVADKNKGAYCVFVGSGSEEEALRGEVKVLKLENRVFFRSPADDIERYYAASDVFILPSVSEGLSNALLEAMATGLAPLGSKVGGTREAVTSGETGLLFESEDKESLLACVSRYVESPDICEAHGRAARKRTLERYSLERIAERYLEIYG
jgi:glycosyltransferase involved in cell wall biosynthesis